MTIQDVHSGSATVSAPAVAAAERKDAYLFSPVVDFMCLGGASLLILPVMFSSPESLYPALIGFAFILADFINHPHFAHSYQIFYRGFGQKIRGGEMSAGMRRRYLVAGVVVPLALVGFFSVALMQDTPTMMGYGANLMLFLVGWHYVKQGYGMLIVDSVLKRKFFKENEKTLFRYNAYACWWLYWLAANEMIHENQLWGLSYYSFNIPDPLLYAATTLAVGTSVVTLATLGRKFVANREALPLTGVVVYLVTLYLWVFGRLHPGLLIFIPVFHSLQYLTVVWRFEINRAHALGGGGMAPKLRLGSFAVLGIALGYLGFWLGPLLMTGYVSYDAETFGSGLFLFMFWVFINVHHYVMDNVIWRSENPETKKYLFAPRPA